MIPAKKFKGSGRKCDKRYTKLSERFEGVDQHFEKVDQRFEKVDQRFEKVYQRQDAHFRWLMGTMITLLISFGSAIIAAIKL